MALKRMQDNSYLKLSCNDSKIMGNKIYAYYDIYKTSQEREKDKAREANYIAFMQRLREFIDVREKQINTIFANYNVNPQDPNGNFGAIPAETMTRIQAQSDYLSKFSAVENYFENYYSTRESVPTINYASILSELNQMGFSENWVNNPILMCGTMEIYCGEYAGQPITPELFYTKTKTVMTNLIDC